MAIAERFGKVVFRVAGGDVELAEDFAADDGAREVEAEGGVAGAFPLLGSEASAAFGGGLKTPFVLPVAGEEAEPDALIEQVAKALGGDLDVSVDEDALEFQGRHLGENLVLFGDQDTGAGAAEDGALFGDVKEARMAFLKGWALIDGHGAWRGRGRDESAAGPLEEVGVAHATV